MTNQSKTGRFLVCFSALLLVLAAQGEAKKGQGTVSGISGREIEISLGQADGVESGTRLEVIRYKDIKRGEHLLRRDKLKVGEIEVVEVKEDSSLGKMLRSYRTVQEGDIVLFTSSAPATKPDKSPAKAAPTKPVQTPTAPTVTAKPSSAPATPPAPIAKVEPAAAAVSESTPTPKATSKEKALGTLTIHTIPSGAELYLNGQSLGTSPKTILDLEPTKYQLRINKDNYYPWQGSVQIQDGKTRTLSIKLKLFEGDLRVNSIPSGAYVLIDGKPRGKTTAQLHLKPGKHKLELEKAGYKRLKKIVDLSANKALTVDLILKKIGAAPIEDMIYIPAGDFIMGSEAGSPHEQPVHTVTLDSFYIDKYEVTNAAYRKFVEATGHQSPAFWHDNDLNQPNQPVVGVTWEDANAYAKWVGKRLPTEAEWEKASRGFDGRTYPWGNKYERGRANKAGNSDSHQFAAPARSFAGSASPYGVINMAGNVWEWCADWYAKNYYAKAPKANPKGPAEGKHKVIRGGSWEDPAQNLRASNRYFETPNYFNYNLGFRCAK